MIDEMLHNIYEITVNMKDVLQKGDYQEFEKLLDDRNTFMLKIEEQKNRIANFEYSVKAKEIIQETIRMNEQIVPFLEKEFSNTETMIQQLKMNKVMSKKYQPYMRQTNGAFIDTTK